MAVLGCSVVLVLLMERRTCLQSKATLCLCARGLCAGPFLRQRPPAVPGCQRSRTPTTLSQPPWERSQRAPHCDAHNFLTIIQEPCSVG